MWGDGSNKRQVGKMQGYNSLVANAARNANPVAEMEVLVDQLAARRLWRSYVI